MTSKKLGDLTQSVQCSRKLLYDVFENDVKVMEKTKNYPRLFILSVVESRDVSRLSCIRGCPRQHSHRQTNTPSHTDRETPDG